MQLGWKPHPTPSVEDRNKVLSVLIENNHFPDFNQQLLLHNPSEALDVSGFLELGMLLRVLPQDISLGSFMIPMESLKPFQPLHLEMILNDQTESARDSQQERQSLFLSIVLEKPFSSAIDQLSYAVVKYAQFTPLPSNVKRYAVGFTTESEDPFEIPYVKLFAPNPDSMAQVLQYYREQTRSVYVS